MTNQQIKLKNGDLKHVAVLLKRDEYELLSEIEDLFVALGNTNYRGLGAVFKFMLYAYGKQTRKQLLKELKERYEDAKAR